MSTAGATGPAPPAKPPDRRELEMQTGRKAVQSRTGHLAGPKTNGAAPVPSFPSGETFETRIGAAMMGEQAERIKRDAPPAERPLMSETAAARKTVTPREFLLRVLPFPADDQPGFINVHGQCNFEPGKTPWTGWPTRNVDTLLQKVQWALSWRTPPDLYMCLSRQAETRPDSKGNQKAAKSQENALALKAIYADLDVKPGAYMDLGEAIDALKAFRDHYKLPPPTALVASGGGLHVYYISDRELTSEEWQPYAEGLKAAMMAFGIKFDAGVTTDSARVLRIPSTFNYKLPNNPRPVRLLGLQDHDYDFAKDLGALLSVQPPLPRPATAVLPGRPAPEFASLPLESLAEGIGHEPLPPLDWVPIGKQCGWFREAITTGGRDFSQGLWNLSTLAATFMEDGHDLAHKMAQGYPSYDYAETEVLWERKLAERSSLGLGWPSCKAIQAVGCKHCATCKHLAAEKSPLHLARISRPAPPAVQNGVIDQPKEHNNTPTRAPATAATFRDFTDKRKPRPSLANAVIAIRALAIEVRYDLFHHRIKVRYKGEAKTIHEGLLTDDTVSAVRSLINNTYRIDCGDANTLAALREIAFDNAYDPVLDLLKECQSKWDGKKRIDTWVIDYLGCEDTPLNRAIGRLVLIAACRRARDPGCKFDLITVLEGPEGINKSTAIRVLAGDENFSDQSILGASDKEVQEQLEGVWMHENADLAGMKRAEVEQIKAFASRQVDRARPAYGRVREDRPRRSIEWGTTNNDTYLQSQTGNRRFGPLRTGQIDIEPLRRDREQLLGEAATYEPIGENITLDPSLWGDAREAQEQRRVTDPWEDILSADMGSIVHRSGDGFERVASADVLSAVLQIPRPQQTTPHAQRLAHAMKHVGWTRPPAGRVNIAGKPARGYIRPVYDAPVPKPGAALGQTPDNTGKQNQAATASVAAATSGAQTYALAAEARGDALMKMMPGSAPANP